MSFDKEFELDASNAVKATREVVKVATIESINYLIGRSPVGNTDLWQTDYPPTDYVGGRFRSNWFITKNTPSTRTTDKITNEETKKAGMIQMILNSPYSDSWIITNNLPYAQRIDEGWSTQAVNGMTNPCKLYIEARIPQFEAAANKKYGVS